MRVALNNEAPLEVKFMGVRLRLYTGSHELAILMSLNCLANADDKAGFDDFYAFLPALYHRWHCELWPLETQSQVPFMASVATLRPSETRVVPLIMGASNHRKILPAFRQAQRDDLRTLGFKPLLVKSRLPGQEELIPHNSYGNCAESDHWIVAK